MLLSLNKPEFLALWLLVPIIWIMMQRWSFKDRSTKYKACAGGVRSLLLVILALALADPRYMSHSDRVNVYFCLDVSESIGADQKTAAITWIKKITTNMNKEDRAGLILFGKHPSLDIPLKPEMGPILLRSDVDIKFTNIYEALQLAVGNLPQEGKNKIVLFTDGNENFQAALDMAYLAGSLGIEIYPVMLASWFGKSEVFVKDLKSPPTVSLETPFEIRVDIMSSGENQGGLVLFRNDMLLANQPIKLKSGKNSISYADTLSDPGVYLYRAVINLSEDVFYQNNEGLAFTRATRKSQILYLNGDDKHDSHLAEALKMQGFNLVQKNIQTFPGSLQQLVNYNAIILDNVSGRSMSYTTMENLEKYVKDIGGGLIMVGGDQSFGAGFYDKTPVEKALPVFMDAPAELKFSDLCLIFVIDKSSSMATSFADKTKLEMAKIAVFASIEMLNPTDMVGIVAFDKIFEWIVPIAKAGDRRRIADKLSQLREEGGTDLYPALEDAFKVLEQVQANRKHVIVLSDGETEEADFESLVEAMVRSDISVSTVAVGAGAHITLMNSIAAWGKGRSYHTDNPKFIPKIFTGETKLVTQKIFAEKTLPSFVARRHDMLQGIADGELPVLHGQVVTYQKPGTEVLIKTIKGPILAVWRYGLGRSVAFTSDLSNRWGKDWLLWDHYGKFVSQMVTWAQRKETPKKYVVGMERQGENGKLTVDVISEHNRFVNNLELKVKILFPSGHSQTISLSQTAPGRYQGLYPADEIGEYYFSIFDEKADSGLQEVFGFGIPYTDEFNTTGVNSPLLERLASLTKGKILTFDSSAIDLFAVTSADKDYGRPIWPYLVLVFLILLIVDVAGRKMFDFVKMREGR